MDHVNANPDTGGCCFSGGKIDNDTDHGRRWNWSELSHNKFRSKVHDKK